MGVILLLIRTLFGVYIRVPAFWKLSFGYSDS